MKRLVFLYAGDLRDEDKEIAWDSDKVATNGLVSSFPEQGYFYMFKRLVEKKVLAETLIIVKENRGTGSIEYCPGVTGYAVPNFLALDEVLKDGDILLIRDGFKWLDDLKKLKYRGYPLLFYAAASARKKWDIWDIILEDCDDKILEGSWTDKHGRLHMPFYKPVNPEVFYPQNEILQYAICIGASHIHDRKGQWRVIDALVEYKRKWGVNLTAILPGRFYSKEKTNQIRDKINEHQLNVVLPGMVSKEEMRRIYNSSRLFVSPGTSGQNDRSILEAMRCGCPILFVGRKARPPFLYSQDSPAFETTNIDKPELLAEDIRSTLHALTTESRNETRNHFEKRNGSAVVLRQMERILAAI